ncbi:MAG: trypsin-like peptidase domain-containing protein [Planctomycetota bacterium]
MTATFRMNPLVRFALTATCLLAAASPALAQPAVAVEQDTSLEHVEERARAVAPNAIGAAVGIIVRDANGAGSGNGRGMGSGVIVSEDGLILSAAHVVLAPGAELIIILADGTRVAGETLGVDHDVDAGMARITEPGDYTFAPIAQQGGFAVGDWVLAVGHAGGIQTDRHPPLRLGRLLHHIDDEDEELFGNLASDCTVISGDSGGPLYNLDGEVIGIHSNIGMRVIENRHVAIDEYHERWDAFVAGEDLSTNPHREPVDPIEADDLEEMLDEDGNPINPADTDGDGAISDEEAARNVMRMNLYQQFSHVLTRDEIELLMSVAVVGPNGQMQLDITPQNFAEVSGVLEKLNAAQQQGARMPGPLPRRALRYTRTGEQVRPMLDPVAAQGGESVVAVRSGTQYVALGTVVGDGLILTKASELHSDTLAIRVGRVRREVALVGIDEATDLALLRVERSNGTTPVRWADGDAQGDRLGTVLVSPNAEGEPLALGVVSVGTRAIPETIQSIGNGNTAFLGVSGLGGSGSAVIQEVIEGGAAEAAGMLDGDAIIRIQDMTIANHTDLVEAIGRFEPGTTIEIEVLRNGASVVMHATLQDATGKFDMEANDDLPTAQLSRQAGAISTRRTNFPAAFTHDGVIWAGDMGGPLLGLDGSCVGINIARYGRTATYAIPADEAQRVIAELLASESNE